jgi:hypothetical protein
VSVWLGNLWWIQTHVEDVSTEEMTRRLGDPAFIKAMAYVQGADFFPDRVTSPASVFGNPLSRHDA